MAASGGNNPLAVLTPGGFGSGESRQYRRELAVSQETPVNDHMHLTFRIGAAMRGLPGAGPQWNNASRSRLNS
jgi:hypothetical protein